MLKVSFIYLSIYGTFGAYCSSICMNVQTRSTGPNDTFEFNLTTVEVFWDLIKMEEFYYSEIGGI